MRISTTIHRRTVGPAESSAEGHPGARALTVTAAATAAALRQTAAARDDCTTLRAAAAALGPPSASPLQAETCSGLLAL